MLSGGGTEREDEEHAALAAFCPGADLRLTVLKLPDGRLPAHWERGQGGGGGAAGADRPRPAVRARTRDAHQDHRGLAKLVPTAFRDHLALGYEIVKWDGDLGRPSVYQPLAPEVAEAKVGLLQRALPLAAAAGPGTTARPSSGSPASAGSSATRATPRRSTSTN